MKNYFDAATQQAIVDYQNELDPEIRKTIYVGRIMPAFNSLVENLINVYGYHVMYETKEDLRIECAEFLYGVVTKFNASKGSKAFSYFNVVARNWLTIRSKQNAKSVRSFISIDNREAFSQHELDIIENHHVVPACDTQITQEEHNTALKSLIAEIKDRVKTENEATCVDAINELFENVDDLDFVSKRAVMLYIREITHLSPKQLSIVLSSLKKHYKTIKAEQNQ